MDKMAIISNHIHQAVSIEKRYRDRITWKEIQFVSEIWRHRLKNQRFFSRKFVPAAQSLQVVERAWLLV